MFMATVIVPLSALALLAIIDHESPETFALIVEDIKADFVGHTKGE